MTVTDAGEEADLVDLEVGDFIESSNTTAMTLPALSLEFGYYKAVFRLDLDTGTDDITVFAETLTYFEVIPTPLVAIMIEGSASKVTRGWDQELTLTPGTLSYDPDFIEDKSFTFQWFCRVSSRDEEWPGVDGEGFPIYNDATAVFLPKEEKPAVPINPPPGCFGDGPRPLKTKSGELTINTNKFVTYAATYEFLVVLHKDTRRAMVALEIEVGSIPAPVVAIECLNAETSCTPIVGGVMVNPTVRLALLSTCSEECQGELTYSWMIQPVNSDVGDMEYVECEEDTVITTTFRPPVTDTTVPADTTAAPVVDTLETVVMDVDGTISASTSDVDAPLTDQVVSLVIGEDELQAAPVATAKRRRKRGLGDTALGGSLPQGCEYALGDGESDARDGESLSIRKNFFALNPSVRDFNIILTVTRRILDGTGTKYIYSEGTAYMKVTVNSPPENGTCDFWKQEETGLKKAQDGRALVDLYTIVCADWVDRDGHTINDYVFKATKLNDGVLEEFPMYVGPLSSVSDVRLPVGVYTVSADIYESGGTFASTVTVANFNSYAPTKEEFEATDVAGLIEYHTSVGDDATVAQVIAAEATIRASACYFNITCLREEAAARGNDGDDGSGDNNNSTDSGLTDDEIALIIELANANTDALNQAKSISYDSIIDLNQGSSVLNSIVQAASEVPDILDFTGREAAVELIAKLSASFSSIIGESSLPDPTTLSPFIEGTSGSIVAIIENLNNILYASDLSQIPPSDVLNAGDLDYDTAISPDNPDLPETPEEAFRQNVMKLTRIEAVKQVKEMTSLLDDLGREVVMNSVAGEELRTRAPLGVKMLMARVPFSHTIGKDVTGDNHPDNPLRYTFLDSDTVIEFPLGFCPGDRSNGSDLQRNFKCRGEWGIVIKEWETVTNIYQDSARNLNKVTKQVDVDIYNPEGVRVDVSGMRFKITLVIGRMTHKDADAVSVPDTHVARVDVQKRAAALKRRKRWPIIYHQFNVTIQHASLSVQVKLEAAESSALVVMVRHNKLPVPGDCDFAIPVRDIQRTEDDYLDWFFTNSLVANRTGRWFAGVVSVTSEAKLAAVAAAGSCTTSSGEAVLDVSDLDPDFSSPGAPSTYLMRTYSSGCYYLNSKTDEWAADGQTIVNVTREKSACATDHLTSFATGFFPEVNLIDFDFVFAAASFEDNLTVYLFLILAFTFYVCWMIWAVWRDRKDAELVAAPALRDNCPEDLYLYELLVETGPLPAHSTTANVFFVLDGDDGNTGTRCFTDDERDLFRTGSVDTFVMSVDHSLGSLNYIRIWIDNSGLGDKGSWYCLGVTVRDVQTGETTKFVCDQWLACDRGAFEDDVMIHAVEEDSPVDRYYTIKSAGQRKLGDDHVWWSVYTRPYRSRFTRANRVTVCYAMLMLLMVFNALFYQVAPARIADGLFKFAMLTLDPVDVAVGFMTNVLVFPIVFLLTLMFKRGRNMNKRTNRVDRGMERARECGRFNPPRIGSQRDYVEPEIRAGARAWPSFLRILAWAASLLFIFGGAFFVFAFCVQFGNDKTYQWMTAMITSFFVSVFIAYPIFVVCSTLCFVAWCSKNGENHNDDNTMEDEEPPVIYYTDEDKQSGRVSGRRPVPPRRRFEPSWYERHADKRRKEHEMNTVVKEFSIYFVYVSIVFLISYGNRDPNAYRSKEAVSQAVVHGALNCGILPIDDPAYLGCKASDVPEPQIDFMKVGDANDLWYWIDHTLKPNVRVQPWYNGAQPYGLKGYLNDRVNRLIGYAIIRQVREEIGTCKPAKVVRDVIERCTGGGGIDVEDHRDYCMGWIPIAVASAGADNSVAGGEDNCERVPEYEYTDASEIDAINVNSGVHNYGGGGYIFTLTGHIDALEEKVNLLKNNDWINNRTRAIIVEFAVYNAQVNLFTIVTCVAEFIGGGVQPWARVDSIKLLADLDGFGFVTLAAELLFVVATVYSALSVIINVKIQGCANYFDRDNFWNWMEAFTCLMSVVSISLYVLKAIIVAELTEEFNQTKGNKYIRLSYVALVNEYYTYVLSFTVFTSTLKFSRILSFHRAFMQIAATIKLCFDGLRTFFVEFMIVFVGFSAFFYFMLKNDLENFRDFVRSLENTMAMSIGKFNFAALREADEMAAWIFFVFSVVVNMILINMMIAIINIAFEDIKTKQNKYVSKFALTDYLRKKIREVVGTTMARPVVVKYSEVDEDATDEGGDDENADPTEKTSNAFASKTNTLMKYVEDTYLKFGYLEEEGAALKAKMNSDDEKKMAEYGFDALFMEQKKK